MFYNLKAGNDSVVRERISRITIVARYLSLSLCSITNNLNNVVFTYKIQFHIFFHYPNISLFSCITIAVQQLQHLLNGSFSFSVILRSSRSIKTYCFTVILVYKTKKIADIGIVVLGEELQLCRGPNFVSSFVIIQDIGSLILDSVEHMRWTRLIQNSLGCPFYDINDPCGKMAKYRRANIHASTLTLSKVRRVRR